MNVLGLCAGIGGLELGLHISEPQSRPVCFVERDEFCQRVLRTRWPSAPIWDDIQTFDGSGWEGIVDILTSGFPCQPWSNTGRRQGTKDPRWLWPHITRIINQTKPSWVFLENVPGIYGEGLQNVVGWLDASGYAVAWSTFSCASMGASHRRNRVFILAHKPMAYPARERLEVREDSSASSQLEASQRSRRDLLVWAPDQDHEWGLEDEALRPIELAVCGMATRFPKGLEPDRKPRIQALGNSVSPVVASVAWTVLKNTLERRNTY